MILNQTTVQPRFKPQRHPATAQPRYNPERTPRIEPHHSATLPQHNPGAYPENEEQTGRQTCR
ncbi:hypothetical protein T484DRAFT_1938330 [Baffinella frigidus]|nr:hypothetical protein T484DRAFT_1938330 [Cryptophyta sp. CCMP2293]